MELPKFKYHIDPEGNDVIEESDITCVCCGEKRGYIYTGPVYAVEELDDSICPWCIASGDAAKKFDAEFSDSHPLLSSGISKEITAEVTQRNPGYVSWQQECWLSHCNDACEFHGDASEEDVKHASEETKKQWMLDYEGDEKFWNTVTEGYYPKGDNAFYKFKCRHCNLVLLGWDCS
jgi:uncharacterized protein